MMNTAAIGVMSVIIWVLIFWVLMLRSKISELRQEIQKRKEWHQRSLDRTRERI